MSKNKVPVSTGSMRDFLLEQMIEVVEGRQDHDTALSVCRYSQQVYNFLKLEHLTNTLNTKGGIEFK